MIHSELGRVMLTKISTLLVEEAVVDQAPKLEGRSMTMVLGPKK